MTLIKSIQNVSVTIAALSTSGTATIASVDTANTALDWSGNTEANTATWAGNTTFSDIVLTNGTTLTATVGTAAAFAIVFNVCVIELQPSAVQSVQYGSATPGSASTTANITLAAITLANSIAMFNGWNGPSSSASQVQIPNVQITSTTVLQVKRDTANALTPTIYGCVLEVASGVLNSSTQQAVNSFTGTSATSTLSSIATGQSGIFWGGHTNTSAGSTQVGMVKAVLTNGTTATFTKNTGVFTTEGVITAAEFKSADIVSVNRGTNTIASSSASQASTISAVVVANTAVHQTGSTISGTNSVPTDFMSRTSLPSTTSVQADRVSSTASISTIVPWEALEFSTTTINSWYPIFPDITRGLPPAMPVGWISRPPLSPPGILQFFPSKPDIVRGLTPTINHGRIAQPPFSPPSLLRFFPEFPDTVRALPEPVRRGWFTQPPLLPPTLLNWFPVRPDIVEGPQYQFDIGLEVQPPFSPPTLLQFFPEFPDIVRGLPPPRPTGWFAQPAPQPPTIIQWLPVRPDAVEGPTYQFDLGTIVAAPYTPPGVLQFFPEAPDIVRGLPPPQPTGWFAQAPLITITRIDWQPVRPDQVKGPAYQFDLGQTVEPPLTPPGLIQFMPVAPARVFGPDFRTQDANQAFVARVVPILWLPSMPDQIRVLLANQPLGGTVAPFPAIAVIISGQIFYLNPSDIFNYMAS